MMMTKRNPLAAKPLRCRLTRSQPRRTREIAQSSPPLRWWHIAAGLLLLPMLVLALLAPGFLADLSEMVLIEGWVAAVVPRALLVILAAWAFFGIRAYNVVTGAALLLVMPAALLRIGNAQIIHEDLTLALLLYLVVLAAIPIAVIVRPNHSDYTRFLNERNCTCGEKKVGRP